MKHLLLVRLISANFCSLKQHVQPSPVFQTTLKSK